MKERGGIVAATVVGLLACTPGPGSGQARAQQPPQAKKLIEFGWDDMTTAFLNEPGYDTAGPAYIRANIREMEKRPFDGLVFRLPGGSAVFHRTKWDEATFAGMFEDCRNIQWEKFTDNFVLMLAASNEAGYESMDWFSDADWEAVRHNAGIVARAAALARCRGICFDPEPYGFDPWHYPLQGRKDKTFAEYEVKARQRGAEFVKVVVEHLPRPVIHTLFQLSYFSPPLMDEADPATREQRLSREAYSLLPAFLNGMLDAAGPDVRITDGNEGAYYYTDSLQYFTAYHKVRQRALSMVAPENSGKYRAQVQMSQALYVDYVFGLGRHGQGESPALALSPAERLRWFEHNTYYALTTADEFVWLYSERMNWWADTGLPPGLDAAVRSAREKVAKSQPLWQKTAPPKMDFN